jgi:RluA family pseudouridine synthase
MNLFKYRGMIKSLKQSLEVVHRTEVVLVINKPYDIRIDGDHELTVQKMVWMQFPEFYENKKDPDVRLRFCHQLDFATSGILCMAFTKKATHEIAQLFEQRTTKKEYIALVFGHVKESSIKIDAPIGQDQSDLRNFKMCIRKDGKSSQTVLNVLKHGYYGQNKVTKVLLTPLTGRTHQLRVHTQSIGHPIVGDYTCIPLLY